MSQEKSDYFSNVSNIYFPRVVLEKIDIPENSIIISTIIENPLTEEPAAQSSVSDSISRARIIAR